MHFASLSTKKLESIQRVLKIMVKWVLIFIIIAAATGTEIDKACCLGYQSEKDSKCLGVQGVSCGSECCSRSNKCNLETLRCESQYALSTSYLYEFLASVVSLQCAQRVVVLESEFRVLTDAFGYGHYGDFTNQLWAIFYQVPLLRADCLSWI